MKRPERHGRPGPVNFSEIIFEERAEIPGPGWVPQLAQRLGLDLADALASDGERLADFFEGCLLYTSDAADE